MFTRTTRHKTIPCPFCHKPLDASTSLTSNDPPEPGDVSVCIYCIQLLQFDQEMGLVPLPVRTLNEIERVQPRIAKIITDAVNALITIKLKGSRL